MKFEIDENSLYQLKIILEQKQKQFWNPERLLQRLVVADFKFIIRQKISDKATIDLMHIKYIS